MLFSMQLRQHLEKMTNEALVNFIQTKPRSQRKSMALSILTQRNGALRVRTQNSLDNVIVTMIEEKTLTASVEETAQPETKMFRRMKYEQQWREQESVGKSSSERRQRRGGGGAFNYRRD